MIGMKTIDVPQVSIFDWILKAMNDCFYHKNRARIAFQKLV
jgi:hypothetical protein